MAEHQSQKQTPKGTEHARSTRPRKRRRNDRDDSQPTASLTDANLVRPNQEMLEYFQSRVGNRAVNRLIHPPATSLIQRDGEGDVVVPGIGAPLVGLKRGDGLDYGTEEARPRVQLLQQKLNEKMLANIKVDGMFGALTEQSLREFQESEALEPGPVIDPQTADLLMMERRPSGTPGTPPGSSPPGLEETLLALSGDVLSDSSVSISNAGFDISLAGTNLFDLDDDRKTNAGYHLQDAGLLFSEVSANLMVSAQFMKTSQQGSGKIPAGEEMKKAGANLSLSGKSIWTAGEILTGVSDIACSQAGVMLMECNTLLQAGSVMLGSAGLKMGQAGGESAPIGDPLVGLQRGDGLVVGTWHRRQRVSLLQQKLNERAGAGLKVDGMFGPLTGKALTDFQVSAGMLPRERVDRQTAQALRGTGGPPVSGVEGAGKDLAEAGKRLVDASLRLSSAGTRLLITPKTAIEGRCMIDSGSDLQQAGEAMIIAGSILAPAQP